MLLANGTTAHDFRMQTDFELPVTLRPSKARIAMLCFLSLALAAAGVWIVFYNGMAGYTVDGIPMYWIGWAGMVICGLCALALLIQLLPGVAYLRLTEEGFTYKASFRAHLVRWVDVREFGVMHLHHTRMVGWNYVPGYHRQRGMRGFTKAVAGFEAGLPDTYGLGVERLAEALESLRREFAGNAAGGSPAQ